MESVICYLTPIVILEHGPEIGDPNLGVTQVRGAIPMPIMSQPKQYTNCLILSVSGLNRCGLRGNAVERRVCPPQLLQVV